MSLHRVTDTQLQDLDERLFRGPWVLIAPDNTSPARVRSLDAARAAITDGPVHAVAGRVRDGVLAADIDPVDGYAIYGDVCAEELVAWCLHHDLPYLVRESGRPGGRHVVSLARTRRHRTQWRALCSRLGRRYKTPVDDRTGKSLRLLTAPHRGGLRSPVISCTLTRTTLDQALVAAATPSKATGHRSAPRPAATSTRDTSRSGREYGLLCAMVRSGYSAEAAWRVVATPGSKAAARGLYWWRRYQWLNAVTTVAAENHIAEDEAWRLAQHAWPGSSRRLTHKWWLGLWQRAQQEAGRNRPRRKQLGSHMTAHHAADDRQQDQDAEIAQLRQRLLTAAATVLPSSGTRRQRQASASTALFHLVPALVTRGGAISVRDLAE